MSMSSLEGRAMRESSGVVDGLQHLAGYVR